MSRRCSPQSSGGGAARREARLGSLMNALGRFGQTTRPCMVRAQRRIMTHSGQVVLHLRGEDLKFVANDRWDINCVLKRLDGIGRIEFQEKLSLRKVYTAPLDREPKIEFSGSF